MKTFISMILMLFALTAMAETTASAAESIVNKANAAYEKDDFNQAVQLYEQVARQEGTSSMLYYNMGNAYYRLGNMGKAVLCYERSLLLDPSNDDARTNLEFVNDKLQLKIDRGSSFFSDTIGGFVSCTSSDTWAKIGICAFLLFLVAIVVYIFSNIVLLRKIGFFGGGILLLLSILANICAFYTHSLAVDKNYAVVTISSATLSTSPRLPKDKTEEAFLLNEGTKVEIVDSVESNSGAMKIKWFDVKADEQHRAWIKSTDIERI